MKTLLRMFFTFARIGGFTFGGGYAMLPMLQKGIDILELTVNGRKTNVRYFVKLLKLIHNKFTDMYGSYLSVK